MFVQPSIIYENVIFTVIIGFWSRYKIHSSCLFIYAVDLNYSYIDSYLGYIDSYLKNVVLFVGTHKNRYFVFVLICSSFLLPYLMHLSTKFEIYLFCEDSRI